MTDWITEIEDLINWGDNWNGEGASAVRADTISNCIKLLNETSAFSIDECLITELGTILLYWSDKNDTLISVEIGPTRIAWYVDVVFPEKNFSGHDPRAFNEDAIKDLKNDLEKHLLK